MLDKNKHMHFYQINISIYYVKKICISLITGIVMQNTKNNFIKVWELALPLQLLLSHIQSEKMKVKHPSLKTNYSSDSQR